MGFFRLDKLNLLRLPLLEGSRPYAKLSLKTVSKCEDLPSLVKQHSVLEAALNLNEVMEGCFGIAKVFFHPSHVLGVSAA